MNDSLAYKNYLASVHFSAVDEVFYGRVLAVDDLISFEGSSVKELKAAFEEAIEDYLEACQKTRKWSQPDHKFFDLKKRK